MDFAWRSSWLVLAWGLFPLVAAADPPPATVKADYSGPRETFRTYLDAVQRNDLAAANQCWVFDNDAKPGVINTFLGLKIAPRRFFLVAQQKFGSTLPADFQKRQREDLTDAAIELTRQRLAGAEATITGDTAELKFKWQKDDGYPNPAFDFGEDPISFRKISDNWKLDGNEQTGLQRGADFFKAGSWGPAFRDQVDLMQETTRRMEKGELKTWAETETYFKNGFEAARKRHEERAAEAPNQ